MKTTKRITGLIIALVIISLGGHRALAQQTGEQATGKDTKEVQAEAEYEAQKRAMELQERKLMLQQQQLEQEMKMRKEEIEIARQAAEAEAQVRERERDWDRQRVFVTGQEESPFVFSYGSANQTQLTLRNTFRGGSDESKGEFEVSKETRRIRCMINGRVQSGAIEIKINYPDGKVFKELTINSSAEISFTQSMNIKEGQESKYVGSWKYQVVADKAEGNYLLQISTN